MNSNKLIGFLNHRTICPMCNEELTLFMQWIPSIVSKTVRESLFQATSLANNKIEFTECVVNKFDEVSLNSSPSIVLNRSQQNSSMKFSSQDLKLQASEQDSIYFFYLCNPQSIVSTNGLDFYIKMYDACYHRSSERFSFYNSNLIPKYNNAKENIINANEEFVITSKSPGYTTFFISSINFDEDLFRLWRYSATDEQLSDNLFVPEIQDVVLPISSITDDLPALPKDKLLNKLNSMINLS